MILKSHIFNPPSFFSPIMVFPLILFRYAPHYGIIMHTSYLPTGQRSRLKKVIQMQISSDINPRRRRDNQFFLSCFTRSASSFIFIYFTFLGFAFALTRDFQSKQLTSSVRPRQQALRNSTRECGTSGLAGVINSKLIYFKVLSSKWWSS